MARARRSIAQILPQVDAVVQLLDARAPVSSENPDLRDLLRRRPILTALNKSSLADPAASRDWAAFFAARGDGVVLLDCKTGEGLGRILPALRTLLAGKIARAKSRGMVGRPLRAMVVGIPNVGKSTFINRLAGARRARVEDRPGVTRAPQWVRAGEGLELLDMPGVLAPKFDSQEAGARLAMTGAIRDEILQTEDIALALLAILRARYPAALAARYRLAEIPPREVCTDGELLARIGSARGFLLRGGEVDTARTAAILLDEFRGGKIGRITLELPGDTSGESETPAVDGVS